MLKTFATTFQQEARLACCTSRLVTQRSFHGTRQCLNESPLPHVPLAVVPGSVAEEQPKAKRTRAKKELKSLRQKKEKASKVPKEPKPVVKSILQEGKLLQQLRDIERPGQSVLLEDVERNVQPSAERPPEALQPNSTTSGKTSASLILAQWGWPRPDNHERTVIVRDYPLKMSEALLLLMHESDKFSEWRKGRNVKVGMNQEPLSIRVKGYAPFVEKIAAELRAFQQEILTSTFSAPIKSAFSNECLLQISKAHGAVAEALDDDQISISYLRARGESLDKTKREIVRAAYENEASVQPTLCYYQAQNTFPSENPLYSVLPFSPLTGSPIEADIGPTFRVERVEGLSVTEELVPPSAHASMGVLQSLDQSPLELEQWLRDFKRVSNAQLIVEASPGHAVIRLPDVKLLTTSSPLSGELGLGTIISWLRNGNGRGAKFYPYVPKPIFEFPSASSRSLLRLTYAEASESFSPVQPGRDSTSTLRYELWREPAKSNVNGPVFGMVLPIDGARSDWFARCEERTSRALDVLVPDSAADLRLTASAVTPLKGEDFPESLRKFAIQMRDRYQEQLEDDASGYLPRTGSPPLSIYYRGKRFILIAYKNVRVNRKCSTSDLGKPFEVITENIVDIDNNLTAGEAVCQISCNPEMNEIQWEQFLKNCAWLTRTGVSKAPPPVFEEDILGTLSL
ncbi:hypothetical protein NMY22_g1590 [Coprinellus aureogranulatus]|nr:hypothetical protein NMY22_g1590 [Coprinellus aureogranulatus]